MKMRVAPMLVPKFKLFSFRISQEKNTIKSGYEISIRPDKVAFFPLMERTMSVLAIMNDRTITTTVQNIFRDDIITRKSGL